MHLYVWTSDAAIRSEDSALYGNGQHARTRARPSRAAFCNTHPIIVNAKPTPVSCASTRTEMPRAACAGSATRTAARPTEEVRQAPHCLL